MLNKEITIDICIATYKRPEGIKKLIQSLTSQTLEKNSKIKLIIVDNDPKESSRLIVFEALKNKKTPYVYDCQPQKNIALTRNKCLEHSTSEYIAFIDDDEWAPKDWISKMLAAMARYNADIVFGAVLPSFPDNAPSWVVKGKFFESQNKTGKHLQHGASNNTLIKTSRQMKPEIKFDINFGLTGGSDTELFSRLYKSGAKLVWCNEAFVYEDIPSNRMTVKWLIQRAFRGGQVYARIFNGNKKPTQKAKHIASRLAMTLAAATVLIISLPFGKSRFVWALRKLSANIGQVSAELTNINYQEYK